MKNVKPGRVGIKTTNMKAEDRKQNAESRGQRARKKVKKSGSSPPHKGKDTKR
jgi:hypothetical protein